MESPVSPSAEKYEDGVFTVERRRSRRTASPRPRVRVPKVATLMLTSLILLLVFCFVGLLMSGLHFAHRVPSDDCLGQSWVMFSSILGLLYIGLHLQAARKGEPVARKQPCSQNPLHSGCVVVARLSAIGWAVSLIIVSVAVSRNPLPVSCVDLVASAILTPTLLFILCIDEKAARPFDLPYLTSHSSSTFIARRISAIMAPMHEVSAEDSVSRRGSHHSSSSSSTSTTSTTSSSSSSSSARRGNSNTQHAAAIAAANSPSLAGSISGPRPPPKAAKEPRPERSISFENRTRDQLVASVAEASQRSAARQQWMGGPRALPLSDKAIQTGVLPPPVCFEPKIPTMPGREADKDNPRPQAQASAADQGPGEPGGTWRSDWSALAAETGYVSAPNSSATTPSSTPVPGSSHLSAKASSRCLSPVAEVDDRRLSAILARPQQPRPAPSSSSSLSSLPPPPPSSSAAAPVPRARASSQPSPPPSSSGSSRVRYTAPRSQSSSAYTYASQTSIRQDSGLPPYNHSASAGVPRPRPPVAEPRRASSPARIRLTRTQDSLRVHGSKTTIAVLRRPQRLAADRKAAEDQRSAASAPATRSRPE